MNNTRSKPSADKYGQTAIDYAFNQQAGAFKNLGPILGKVRILGAANNAVDSTKAGGALIAIYNDSAVTAWAATGNASVAAPTGGANGIALMPMRYTIIALGEDSHVRCSTATCWAYLIEDDLQYNKNSGTP